MTKTKRGLMIPAGVLAVVWAVILMLLALTLFIAFQVINLETVKEIVIVDQTVTYTEAEIEGIASLSKIILIFSAITCFAFGLVNMIFAIKVLKNTTMQKTKTGSVITLLVLSILSGNIVTAGLLIAVLCIRDKTPEEQENQIVIEG